MAKGNGKFGAMKSGPGGFLASAAILLVLAGMVFAFAKVNNITSPGAFIDWTRASSVKMKACMEPDVGFWKCGNPFSGNAQPAPSDSESPADSDPGADGQDPVKEAPSGSDNPKPEAPVKDQPVKDAPPVQGVQSKDEALSKLASIPVKDSQRVPYNRDEWNHWIGDRCNDTRQQVLKEQAVSYKLDAKGCKVESGEWLDPYTGKTLTNPSDLDIDHVYSLGAAAKNGANGWDAAKKEKFANDKSNLLAVDDSANQSKSDRNPGSWWPDNKDYSCSFAQKYVDTAFKYELSFSESDVKALEKGLKTCD